MEEQSERQDVGAVHFPKIFIIKFKGIRKKLKKGEIVDGVVIVYNNFV